MAVSLLKQKSWQVTVKAFVFGRVGSKMRGLLDTQVEMLSRQVDTEFGVQGAFGVDRVDVSSGSSHRWFQMTSWQGWSIGGAGWWLPAHLTGRGVHWRGAGPPRQRGRRATPRWLLSFTKEPVLLAKERQSARLHSL